jgi:hypothetical protein
MDGLVQELLRLENAKHNALIAIDAPAYEANVQEQIRLLRTSKGPGPGVTNVQQLLALSQLVSVNAGLVQNLLLTSPLFMLNSNSYTAAGRLSVPPPSRNVSMEA